MNSAVRFDAILMSIGQSDGHSLDALGVGEAPKTQNSMGHCMLRLGENAQVPSLVGELSVLWGSTSEMSLEVL